ncbi:MAG TPA: ABC transporter permease [Miltoncostaeaceae bacterium]|nr:ABC transporter permease [Miltoncostaeaceae bacterium]
MIGVALVAGAVVFAASLSASFGSTLRERFDADVVVDGVAGTTLGDGTAARLSAVPGLASVVPVRATLVREGGEVRDLIAADPAALRRVYDPDLVRGDMGRLAAPGTLALSTGAAEATGTDVGDTVRVTFARTGVVPLRVVALYRDTTFGDRLVGSGTFDANVTGGRTLVLFATARDGVGPEAATAAADRALAGLPGADARTQAAFIDDLRGQVDQLLALVTGMLALTLVVALVGILNALALAVLERTREIGMLRAVGLGRRGVGRAVRAEAALVGLLGALTGVAVGVPLGLALASQVPGVETLAVPAGRVALVIAGATLAGVLAAALPARRAARLDVLRALAQA